MKAPRGPVRRPGKAKPKAKGTSRASKPRQSATKSKSPPKAGAKAAGMRIRHLGDWRGETLDRVRALILEADPEMIEERKWRKPSNAMAGVPVWLHNGIVCTGELYTKVVTSSFVASTPRRGSRLRRHERLTAQHTRRQTWTQT
jgi:hypothetical protein